MKQLLVIACIMQFFFTSYAQDNKTAPLTDVVTQVSNSLGQVEAQNQTGIELKSVTAEFTVSATKSLGGEIKIWIFKLGRKIDKTSLRTISLHLEKNAPDRSKVAPAPDDLTRFLNAALADFKKLNDSHLLEDLDKRTLTLTIGLTITKSRTGGGAYEIGVFSIGADGGRNREQGHTLTIEFGKKS